MQITVHVWCGYMSGSRNQNTHLLTEQGISKPLLATISSMDWGAAVASVDSQLLITLCVVLWLGCMAGMHKVSLAWLPLTAWGSSQLYPRGYSFSWTRAHIITNVTPSQICLPTSSGTQESTCCSWCQYEWLYDLWEPKVWFVSLITSIPGRPSLKGWSGIVGEEEEQTGQDGVAGGQTGCNEENLLP